MIVDVRQVTGDDVHVLKAMLYHAIFVPDGANPPPADIVNAPELLPYVQGFGTQVGDIGVVADVETNCVGAAWVRLMRGYGYVDAHTPELTIAVRPKYRGQGIGSALLTKLFARTDEPYPTISLSVQATNPAHRLYRRFGFTVIDEQDGTYTMIRNVKDSITS